MPLTDHHILHGIADAKQRARTAKADAEQLSQAATNNMAVLGGQTTDPYQWQGGITTHSTDGSANFTIDFTSYLHAVVFCWVVGAEGGSPIAVNIGALDNALGHIDCHASSLEGLPAPTSTTVQVSWGVLGW